MSEPQNCGARIEAQQCIAPRSFNRVFPKILAGVLIYAMLLPISAQTLAGPQIIYVDDDAPLDGNGDTWPTAFKYLQDALAVAIGIPSSEIRLGQGTYTPDRGGSSALGDRNATFILCNNTTLIGGYAGVGALDPDVHDSTLYASILTGDLNMDDGDDGVNYDDNSYHVVTSGCFGSIIMISGLSIEGGNAVSPAFPQGGGLLHYNALLIIKDCIYRRNRADVVGGGVFSSLGDCKIENSRFVNNVANSGAGICSSRGNLAISDCVFVGNASTNVGGGVWAVEATLTVHKSHFEANSANGGGGIGIALPVASYLAQCGFYGNCATGAGAVAVQQGSKASFIATNCFFYGNHAENSGGAIVLSGGVNRLINSSFIDNDSVFGGAVYSDLNIVGDGVTTLESSTLIGNRARVGPAVLTYSDCSLINSLIWFNCGYSYDLAQINTTKLLSIHGCNIQGEHETIAALGVDAHVEYGEDNIAKYPFATRRGFLRATSSCIDAGLNAGLSMDDLDLDSDGDFGEVIPLDINNDLRLADNRLIVDTGAGVAPIVDIGSDEYVDQDYDGLPDVWEMSYFGSPIAALPEEDSDEDQATNLSEYEAATDPRRPPWFVDALLGDDGWDGRAPTYQGLRSGPKRTIQAGIDVAEDGDTVLVSSPLKKSLTPTVS